LLALKGIISFQRPMEALSYDFWSVTHYSLYIAIWINNINTNFVHMHVALAMGPAGDYFALLVLQCQALPGSSKSCWAPEQEQRCSFAGMKVTPNHAASAPVARGSWNALPMSRPLTGECQCCYDASDSGQRMTGSSLLDPS
jgi:hypothetical protein